MYHRGSLLHVHTFYLPSFFPLRPHVGEAFGGSDLAPGKLSVTLVSWSSHCQNLLSNPPPPPLCAFHSKAPLSQILSSLCCLCQTPQEALLHTATLSERLVPLSEFMEIAPASKSLNQYFLKKIDSLQKLCNPSWMIKKVCTENEQNNRNQLHWKK